MAKTTILEEQEDIFACDTGEIHRKNSKIIKASKLQETDQYVKVSRYINTIFAYQNIPLTLVPISLVFAQFMEFRTNRIYLLKENKIEIAAMLGCSLNHVNNLILECKKYDILRPRARGVYEVNSFLYSTGNLAETRNLQALMDFEAETLTTQGTTHNLITGECVKKSVTDAKKRGKLSNTIPGQLTLDDLQGGKS